MNDPIRLLIHGAGGRMGRALLAMLDEFPALHLVAAVSRRDHSLPDAVPAVTAEQLNSVPAFDVAVDFALAPAFDPLLALCVSRGAALVSGTTALSTGQHAAIAQAAGHIAILRASNFSIGVTVLQLLVEQAAARLADWDCEIVETHHRRKLDAPSGTAVSLVEAVARGRGLGDGWVDRIGTQGARAAGSVGVASLRGGSVVGDHRLMLFGDGEQIELAHRADDRAVFARGALHAALRIGGLPPGLYGLRNVI